MEVECPRKLRLKGYRKVVGSKLCFQLLWPTSSSLIIMGSILPHWLTETLWGRIYRYPILQMKEQKVTEFMQLVLSQWSESRDSNLSRSCLSVWALNHCNMINITLNITWSLFLSIIVLSCHNNLVKEVWSSVNSRTGHWESQNLMVLTQYTYWRLISNTDILGNESLSLSNESPFSQKHQATPTI